MLRFGMKSLRYCTIPRKPCNSFFVEGISKSTIARIFSGDGHRRPLWRICPRNSVWVTRKRDLRQLAKNLCLCS